MVNTATQQQKARTDRQPSNVARAAGTVAGGGLVEPAAAAKMALGSEEGEAQDHQYEAERGRPHQVVAPGHLHVHRPRERRIAQDRHGAEVGHDVKADEKQPRGNGRPLHGQHHAQPGAQSPGAGQPRGLLERQVGAQEGRAAQQVDVGIGSQAEHHNGGGQGIVQRRQVYVRPQETLDQRPQRTPIGKKFRVAVGHDVGRDAERRSQQPCPYRAPEKVVAHHQPRQADAQDHGDDGHAGGQPQGVVQQFRYPAPPQLQPHLAGNQESIPQHVAQRHDDQQGHREGDDTQRLGPPRLVKPRNRGGGCTSHQSAQPNVVRGSDQGAARPRIHGHGLDRAELRHG